VNAPSTTDTDLRVLYVLLLVAASAFIPFYVLLLRARGLSPDEIGLVLAVTSLAGVASTPFWSHAADARLGTVRTLRAACSVAAAMALVMIGVGSSVVAIAIAAAVLGAAQGPQTPLTDALALRRLGPRRLTEYGRFRLWGSIGWGVGAIVFGAVFERAGMGAMLPVYAVGIAVYAVYISRFPNAGPEPGQPLAASRLGSIGEALRSSPRLGAFLLGVLVFGTSTHAAADFIPLRIVAGGGGAFLVGIAAGVSAFVEIPFMHASHPLVQRIGLRAVFIAGAAVYLAASVSWMFVTDARSIAFVRIAIGIGFGLTYVTLVMMAGRLVQERFRNTGQALLTMCSFGLAPVLGGALGGIVYERIGAVQLFAASALGIVVGAGLVYAAARDVGRREASPS
jgi:PPP family 3-phenylpropionic acid transporter